MSSGSGTHRTIGLQECPLCKNISYRRVTCKACMGAGKVTVDHAIEIGLSMSDTEREMGAVKDERKD